MTLKGTNEKTVLAKRTHLTALIDKEKQRRWPLARQNEYLRRLGMGPVAPARGPDRATGAVKRGVDHSPRLEYRGVMHVGRSMAAHPLGPIVFQAEAERPMAARAVAAAVLGGCAVLFAVAAWLDPTPVGTNNLEHFGLPPCGMMMRWGLPCPTCGMTTAFAHAARGQLASAFHAQPAGLTIAIAIAVAAIAAGGTLVTGRTYRVNWYRVSPTGVGISVLGVLLAGWAYKILTVLSQ